MPNIQIVTDSSAHFAVPHFLHQFPMVTIVPNFIHIGGKIYRDGFDLTPDEGFRLIAHQPHTATVKGPTEADFVETYRRLVQNGCDGIISIHASREILPSYNNALAAASQFGSSCPIAVIDSQNLCAGQGMLVKAAVKATQKHELLDDMVRELRGAIERIFSLYYVETVHALQHNQIMSPSHMVLSSLLGIKAFLGIENGHIQVVEKVRTRTQAVDRLVDFVMEFADLEDVVILQHKSYLSEQARMIQDRLSIDFPDQYFTHSMYGATLAALIGTDATGVVIMEKEMEDLEDDF
ncbi:MAG: DegV family protein [Anaerolineae bacterium]